jgi:hypothetical protein
MHPTLKRTLAVLAGLVACVAGPVITDQVLHATGFFPREGAQVTAGLWCLAVGYRFAFTLLGGWLAGRLDPAKSMKAAWIVTGIGVFGGLSGVGVAYSHPEMGPAWYAWAVALTGPPAAWLGGKLATSSTR